MSTKPPKSQSNLENVTTLHGAAQFKLKKGGTLTLWTFMMVGNLVLTVIFLLVITRRYNNDQIVTKINPNCLVSQVPFPAVSICNFNLVSLRETSVMTNILKYNNRTEDEIVLFYQALQRLKDFDKLGVLNDNFTDIIAILKHHYFTIDSVMEEVHQKCDKLLLHCTFNGVEKNCNDIFTLIKTYEGHCCTFNYAALKDYIGPQWTKDDDIEYYEDSSATDGGFSEGIIVTSQSGRGSGLSVVFNVEPKEYPSWSPVPYYAAKILLSDPNDFPETTVLYKFVSVGDSIDIKVEPQAFQCEDEVRRVEPLKRACWFHDEVDLENTDRYSYETCRTECKMRNYLKYCGCVPYKYPREASVKVCEFEDLPCLSHYRIYTTPDWSPCDPLCLPGCRDKKYSISSDIMPFLWESVPSNVTEGRNWTELAAVQVYFSKSTANCYKLSLLMDFNYFIVTYGGVFSLSFGASILTVFEMIILLLASLLRVFKRHYKQK